ncbi:uncharacterized protein LOC135342230 [Halichondria panicea]|uniref:uncharacterized protein LOC135342230 n=1 Tax=Halichondria panicea TaxID=6063 RepID=UPI00312B63B9
MATMVDICGADPDPMQQELARLRNGCWVSDYGIGTYFDLLVQETKLVVYVSELERTRMTAASLRRTRMTAVMTVLRQIFQTRVTTRTQKTEEEEETSWWGWYGSNSETKEAGKAGWITKS